MAISFDAKLSKIGSRTVLRLPGNVSLKLPSRGQVVVEGSINGVQFQSPLEPDGNFSHWFSPSDSLLKGAHAKVGDTVNLKIEPSKVWPEPEIPQD
ncbi:MAG: DUF1905 domain-containing protein, partial [Candidatus Saccharimonadales bacterium]